VSHLGEWGREEVEGSIFFVHLFPLLLLILIEQEFLGRVVGLVMTREFRLHGCDVDNSSLLNVTWSPCIIQLLLFFLIFLILVPFDPAAQKSIKNLVDFELFPFRRHEVTFAGGMGTQGHGVVILQFVRVVRGGDGLGSHFAWSDTVDDLELLVGQSDIFHVEFVSDGTPPVFILGLLDELLDGWAGLGLDDLFEVIIIPKVLELIIPPIGNLTDFDLYCFILFIIGLVVTQLYIILFFVLGGGSGPLQILGQGTGFLVAGNHLLNLFIIISWLGWSGNDKNVFIYILWLFGKLISSRLYNFD
jgi:hypothetical protein